MTGRFGGPLTRARVARERLDQLKRHQTQQRQLLQARVIRDLLADGHTLDTAAEALGLSRSYVHKAAGNDTVPPRIQEAAFAEIDAAVERYVLGEDKL